MLLCIEKKSPTNHTVAKFKKIVTLFAFLSFRVETDFQRSKLYLEILCLEEHFPHNFASQANSKL